MIQLGTPPQQIGPDGSASYDEAVRLCRINRFEEAARKLDGVLAEEPDHAPARELLDELRRAGIGVSSAPKKENLEASTHPSRAPAFGPTTLARIATSPESWREILDFHSDLASDAYVNRMDCYYRKCRERFGDHWYYFDITNVLYAASKTLRPRNYLEIGVRRGRSVCTVARGCPSVNIVGFDLWVPDYAGMENPGPDFVKSELARHAHVGTLELITGNSHDAVPEYFRRHPQQTFDLITVDGDHSEAGALDDLLNVIPRLSTGGVLVFDDIAHPEHPYLLNVWRDAVKGRTELRTFEYTETGYGVAFAILQEK
ncbi:class I SAM-dependent methyltransferase [bacterium]|nr:class I SAM-dependent methyltransferase [bacterium]MBU1985170.1 class I SAM-dependent methyltransferase [bacterium]